MRQWTTFLGDQFWNFTLKAGTEICVVDRLKRALDEIEPPICPGCHARGVSSPLGLNFVEDEREGDILAGILGCSDCGAEYPIVDGLPIIVPDVRRYVQDNLFYIMARTDLTPAVESLLQRAKINLKKQLENFYRKHL